MTFTENGNIVGTTEWGNDKWRRGTEGVVTFPASDNELGKYVGLYDKYSSNSIVDKKKQATLIDNIADYVDFNNWKQIEGGENDNKWMNSKYPGKVFNTGRVYDCTLKKMFYFPVADMENDPEGIALHYEINGQGTSYKIRPNAFMPCGNAKQRKKWKRKAMAIERNNNDKKFDDDCDEENNYRNDVEYNVKNTDKIENKRPTIAKINGNGNTESGKGNGIKLQITEKEPQHNDVIDFSGPTPGQAYEA